MRIPRNIRRGISLTVLMLILGVIFFFIFSKTSGNTGSVTYIERLSSKQSQEANTLPGQTLSGEGPFEIEGFAVEVMKIQREKAIGKGNKAFNTNNLFYIVFLRIVNNQEVTRTLPKIAMIAASGHEFESKQEIELIFDNILPTTIEGKKSVTGFHIFEVPVEESVDVELVTETTRYVLSR